MTTPMSIYGALVPSSEDPCNVEDWIILEEFDGPLHMYAKLPNDQMVFTSWCDCNDEKNRWLVFVAEREASLQYLHLEISLYRLLLRTNQVFLVDIGENFEERQSYRCSLEDLPADYIPPDTIFPELGVVDKRLCCPPRDNKEV